MRVLAVETSTLTGAVALLTGDTVVAEWRLSIAVTHSERLLSAVDHLLTAAGLGLSDIDALAVAVGPGSFTGLRIGVSTMKSLAFATGKPLVAVPTLDALAWSLPFAAYPVCPILDAKKGEVYTALYRTEAGRLERLWEYRALAPERLAEALVEEVRGPVVFLGDGVAPFAQVLRGVLGGDARLAPPGQRLPSAIAVADLARGALERGETADPASLVPIYIRRSEAELGPERQRVGHSH
ncbi:MAG: tRNA (adenosine(37)-N6)-threonylcarbamoyltransferase complex dimerization subunit type 1 TsaB [Candidatus Rokubacteria bacterium]|nr:tRNA (adenosine(37)-N6)-threonylcarbamoyltransferase complex dimerization subunit type 1 TsaB [Candidatus Rokubacteria bacterium]